MDSVGFNSESTALLWRAMDIVVTQMTYNVDWRILWKIVATPSYPRYWWDLGCP